MTENTIAKLEALLFIYGEPLTYKKLAKILDLSESEIKTVTKNLAENLASENRGLSLIVDDEKVQLVTKPEFASLIADVIKSELHEELSPASLETLSIIIYAAPISRAEIDYIRGVNSSFILRSLLIRGLIEREADPHRPNAFIYKPSFELLKHLGVKSLNDLPEFEQFQLLINNLRKSFSDPHASNQS